MIIDYGDPVHETKGVNARRAMMRWLNRRNGVLVSCYGGSSVYKIQGYETVLVKVNGFFHRTAYKYPNLEQAEMRFLYDKIYEYIDQGWREIEDLPAVGYCRIGYTLNRSMLWIETDDFRINVIKRISHRSTIEFPVFTNDCAYSIQWERGSSDVIRRAIMALRMST